MDETKPVAQEGTYPVRDQENEKIREMLREGIDSDRRVFAVMRERLPSLSREAAEQRPADNTQTND